MLPFALVAVTTLYSDTSSARLDDPRSQSKSFFLLLRALRTFVLTTSHLPISASLPDMKSSTSAYVALQSLYKTKAKEDLEAVKICLAEVLGNVGLDEDAVGEAEIDEFVKNAAGLKVLRGRNLREEREAAGEFNKEAICESALSNVHSPFRLRVTDPPALLDPLPAVSFSPDHDWNVPYVPPPIVHYIASRASDAFQLAHGRLPGTPLSLTVAQLESDVAQVEALAKTLLESKGYVADPEDEDEGGLPKSVRDAVGEMYVPAPASSFSSPVLHFGLAWADESPVHCFTLFLTVSGPARRICRPRPPTSVGSSPKRPSSS